MTASATNLTSTHRALADTDSAGATGQADVVVVGVGFAGLSAARPFARALPA